jgi:gamma-glutamyltranspeptidase / glutathione hydrolase
VVLNVIDFRMNMQQAVDASRIHHQWLPDVILIEENGVPPRIEQQLAAMGHMVRFGGSQGRANCIMIDLVTGMRIGAADPRDEDGAAVGY